MSRMIDADELKKKILAVRDSIPRTVPRPPYELIGEKQYGDGDLMRCGIRKALRCMEETSTVDVVPKCLQDKAIGTIETLRGNLDAMRSMYEDSENALANMTRNRDALIVRCKALEARLDNECVNHAHWKYIDGAVICSRCNNVVGGFPDIEKDAIKDLMEDDKYCYNCGAKMDEEERNDIP